MHKWPACAYYLQRSLIDGVLSKPTNTGRVHWPMSSMPAFGDAICQPQATKMRCQNSCRNLLVTYHGSVSTFEPCRASIIDVLRPDSAEKTIFSGTKDIAKSQSLVVIQQILRKHNIQEVKFMPPDWWCGRRGAGRPGTKLQNWTNLSRVLNIKVV